MIEPCLAQRQTDEFQFIKILRYNTLSRQLFQHTITVKLEMNKLKKRNNCGNADYLTGGRQTPLLLQPKRMEGSKTENPYKE